MDLDMRQLPGLVFGNHTRNETAQVILKELDARVERVRHNLAIGKYPEGGADDGDTTMNCTFSMYGQLRPLPSQYSRKQIAEYESELHKPTGRSVANLPSSQMDAIIFSRDCNLVVELDNMEGLERDMFWDKAITYAAILSIITILQTWVLVKQMEYTSTPTVSSSAHATKWLLTESIAGNWQGRASDDCNASHHGCLLFDHTSYPRNRHFQPGIFRSARTRILWPSMRSSLRPALRSHHSRLHVQTGYYHACTSSANCSASSGACSGGQFGCSISKIC